MTADREEPPRVWFHSQQGPDAVLTRKTGGKKTGWLLPLVDSLRCCNRWMMRRFFCRNIYLFIHSFIHLFFNAAMYAWQGLSQWSASASAGVPLKHSVQPYFKLELEVAVQHSYLLLKSSARYNSELFIWTQRGSASTWISNKKTTLFTINVGEANMWVPESD